MEKLKSRKLIMVIAIILICFANQWLPAPIPEGTLESMIGMVMAYVGGQSIVDGLGGVGTLVRVGSDLSRSVQSVARKGEGEPKDLLEG